MATTADFRNGLTIQFSGDIYQIVEFQHVKPGKGGAFVRTKLKSLTKGKVIDNTFRAGEKVDVVRVEARKMQYLYREANSLIFMDQETYEQILLEASLAGDMIKFLKEGEEVKILFHGSTALGLELPFFIEYEIESTEPGVKGDTVSGSGKPATIETGAVVQVPFFIEVGDTIRVDTRTGEYMERVKAKE
ncbi:MAG: elongation factor P [candidate division Zixibacteria bacterium]|nr:elongation factor P [Candidatus Tariuqbacter arcticus]